MASEHARENLCFLVSVRVCECERTCMCVPELASLSRHSVFCLLPVEHVALTSGVFCVCPHDEGYTP